MNSLLPQAPLGPERLPAESARAYRAFSCYRDLGPERSLDRAWSSFRTAQGKDAGSARHPGTWGAWSHQHHWVERAAAYDELLDQEKLAAAAKQRRKREDDLVQFQIEQSEKSQNIVRLMTTLVEKTAKVQPVEVTTVVYNEITETTKTTKIKAFNLPAIATMAKVRNEMLTQIQGMQEEVKERKIDRVVWIKDTDAANPMGVGERLNRWRTEPRTGHIAWSRSPTPIGFAASVSLIQTTRSIFRSFTSSCIPWICVSISLRTLAIVAMAGRLNALIFVVLVVSVISLYTTVVTSTG